MPNVIQSQVQLDGPRNYVVKLDLSLDGASGDILNQKVIDLKTLSGMGPTFGPNPTRIRVDVIDWDVQDGLAVTLTWEGQGPTPIWRLTGRSLEKALIYGGIQNNADQPTGNILLSTTSTTPGAPLVGTVKIHCVKQA